MAIKLCSIASGSSGNCIYLGGEDTGLLVDAGISRKAILESLKGLDICFESIKALLVTHEHTDHIRSIGALSRKFDIPIYANGCTWEAMEGALGNIKSKNIKLFETDKEFQIDNITIKPFLIPHDAAEPVGFTFDIKGLKLGVATDLGTFDSNTAKNLQGSEFVMLESNHDEEMLKAGDYPYFLKRRIMGEFGHLSNESAGYAVCELVKSGVEKILLGHLSRENNFPQLAYETVKGIIEENNIKYNYDIKLELAPRNSISKVFMWGD